MTTNSNAKPTGSAWIRFLTEGNRAQNVSDLADKIRLEFESAKKEDLATVVLKHHPDALILEGAEPFGFSIPSEIGSPREYYVYQKPRNPTFQGRYKNPVTDSHEILFETNTLFLAVWMCLVHSLVIDGDRWDPESLLENDVRGLL